jgi:hypothetical protein
MSIPWTTSPAWFISPAPCSYSAIYEMGSNQLALYGANRALGLPERRETESTKDTAAMEALGDRLNGLNQ